MPARTGTGKEPDTARPKRPLIAASRVDGIPLAPVLSRRLLPPWTVRGSARRGGDDVQVPRARRLVRPPALSPAVCRSYCPDRTGGPLAAGAVRDAGQPGDELRGAPGTALSRPWSSRSLTEVPCTPERTCTRRRVGARYGMTQMPP
jgi:hypothetical protein